MQFATLITETIKLVERETTTSTQIILNLKVFFENKVHLQMGYPSFFSFCVGKLKMCEANAHRKIEAMKLSRVVPDLPQRIESGQITLSKVSLVSKFIREEKKDFHKKEVTALLDQVQETGTTREAVRLLAAQSQVEHKSRDMVSFQKGSGKTRLEFEIDRECEELLERVKSLQSHLGRRNMNEILETVLKEYVHRNDPAQKGVKSKKQVAVQTRLFKEKERIKRDAPLLSVKVKKRSRAVPQSIRALVWKKHEGRCTYTDSKTLKTCGSQFRVQIEHKTPFSLGGTHEPENLTLLCQSHNLYRADQMGLLGN